MSISNPSRATHHSASTLPGDAIVITGLGMVSSLGADVVTSCAAARAGLTRWKELDIRVTDKDTLEAVPLQGQEITWLTHGFEGFARWLRLGDAALRDLLEYSQLGRAALPHTGIYLQLPGRLLAQTHLQSNVLSRIPEGERARVASALASERAEAEAQFTRRLIPELLGLNQLSIPPRAQAYFFGGAATFSQVLTRAMEALRTRTLERCIVGGIDSWVDDEPLTQAYDLGLLRTPDKPVGRFPGEAAAFVLLERLDCARERGAVIEGLLGPVASAEEKGHRFAQRPITGTALFESISACCHPPTKQEDIGLSIINLNGDAVRAREYGHALVRMEEAGLPASAQRWYVAEHFGELGAATGATAICLGVRGLVRQYARSPAILVALLDDEPHRSAFLLRESPWRPENSPNSATHVRQS
ncbi:hypothetical protein JKA73_35770 [Myxococcus xanthus]|uniref:hypothetical protein n=1 Tax=Myxococcus xanthus TaxID=34 RepID=UPI0019175463|nr:hypothetical protein [Myxococcus xanthus]QQR44276.1 hypothetical protein JKA73_35770 [Myxococcus xanthus]